MVRFLKKNFIHSHEMIISNNDWPQDESYLTYGVYVQGYFQLVGVIPFFWISVTRTNPTDNVVSVKF